MQGAQEMSENEHLLNVHVSKNAYNSCADFLGYTLVKSSADVSDRRITPGKWLVRTLRRNVHAALLFKPLLDLRH